MKKSPLFRLLTHSKGEQKNIILATSFSIINKLFDLAPELLIGIAIDIIVSKKESFIAKLGYEDPWTQILILGVITFFVWVFESISEYLFMIKWRGVSQTIQHQLRIQSYRHIQKLDVSYFEDQSTGNLVSILNDDINQLERFLDGGANQLIQTLTAVAGLGTIFFIISPQIALISFVPIPIIIMGAFYFQRKATPLYAIVREKVGLLSAKLSNNISGILTIKSFTTEEREASLLEKDSSSYVQANKKAIAISSAFIPIIRMAILSGFLSTFLLGAWKVMQGDLRVGLYGVLVFLTQRLLWPMTALASTIDLYERAMASTKRVLDLLNTPITIHSGHLSPKKINGHFEFKNVSFKYKTGSDVLKNISLEILPQKTTAFIGATGSGKSSLIKLLLRFYEPTSGKIFLDGSELNLLALSNLRSKIGFVSQDVFLFHGTVRENLLYGVPHASDAQMIEAAKLAEAHDFINNLTHQYDTLIGERGQKLSGGQRQRLSIARALLNNPDILILDEATSAIDNETEAAIQRSIKMISQNRTTIVIAHRLSTIVHADQIYVLEHGEIQQKGTHAQLIKTQGHYKQYWEVQTGL